MNKRSNTPNGDGASVPVTGTASKKHKVGNETSSSQRSTRNTDTSNGGKFESTLKAGVRVHYLDKRGTIP